MHLVMFIDKSIIFRILFLRSNPYQWKRGGDVMLGFGQHNMNRVSTLETDKGGSLFCVRKEAEEKRGRGDL